MNVDKWIAITINARVWSDTKEVHKMGWVGVESRLHVVEEYSGYYRFTEVTGSYTLNPITESYPEYWVNIREAGAIEINVPIPPTTPPSPVQGPSDIQLGAALRLLVNFIMKR